MSTIEVTDRAFRRIGQIVADEPSGTALRISVEGGGCSGFQYKFDLTQDAAADDDLVFERQGVRVLIDPMSADYMEGSVVDFVDDLIGASFKIKNPLATAACGCGTSFSL